MTHPPPPLLSRFGRGVPAEMRVIECGLGGRVGCVYAYMLAPNEGLERVGEA